MIDNGKEYPLVVACLATWNGESFIADTLASLAIQTYPNLKVIISDDVSTDNTAAICESFAAKDFRFHLLRQSQRLGWVGNVNTLLHAAQGDYLFLISHDDVIESTYVMRLVETLENQPSAILAFSDMEFIKLNGDIETQSYRNLEGIKNRVIRGHRMLQRQGVWWIPYRGIFRAIAVEDIRGLRTNLAGEFAADWSWLVHMSLLGEFIRVPEALYRKVEKNTSLSRNWKYTSRPWLAATLACASEIYRSRLSLIEKILLHISLASTCLHQIWKSVLFHLERKRLGRLVFKLGFQLFQK